MKHIHYGMMLRTPGSTCDMTTLLCLIIFVYPSLCIALETLHVSPELSHHIRNDGGLLTGENYVVLHARKCQFDAIYNLV